MALRAPCLARRQMTNRQIEMAPGAYCFCLSTRDSEPRTVLLILQQ